MGCSCGKDTYLVWHNIINNSGQDAELAAIQNSPDAFKLFDLAVQYVFRFEGI